CGSSTPPRMPSARSRMSCSGCEHGGTETVPPSPPTLRARDEPARSASAGSAPGVVVATVRAESDAAAGGLRAQDRVLAVNGAALRDAIDFQFHAGDATLALELERDGRRQALTIVRARGDLGVELVPPRPGDIATCANKCVFCFIHQLPKGMRK